MPDDNIDINHLIYFDCYKKYQSIGGLFPMTTKRD